MSEQLSFEGAMMIVNDNKWIKLKDIEKISDFIQKQQAIINALKKENKELKEDLEKGFDVPIPYVENSMRRLRAEHKVEEQQATINKQLDQIIELQDKYRILEFNHSRLEKRNKAQYEKIDEQQATINQLQSELELTSGEKLFSRRELERKVKEQEATIQELERKLKKYAKIGEEQLKQITDLQDELSECRARHQPITINLTEEDEKELRKLLGLIDDE